MDLLPAVKEAVNSRKTMGGVISLLIIIEIYYNL